MTTHNLSPKFWRFISNFVVKSKLNCFDVNFLPNDLFIFISNCNFHFKWLDHIISNETTNCNITIIKICYNTVGSDHFPLAFNLRINYNTNIFYQNLITPVCQKLYLKLDNKTSKESEIFCKYILNKIVI